jgi:HK97 family phage prohead protease
MTTTKTYEVAQFKALPDENGTKGRFEALVSVFGNVDLQGDRVVKGAFAKSLEKWQESGDPIPIVWSHEWANPFAHIGSADPKEAEETDDGLKIVGTLDMDDPFAAKVYSLLKQRRVKEFSFAYDIIEEQEAEDKANELKVLDLIEAGPTLKGANPETQLLGVKRDLEEAAEKGGSGVASDETPWDGSAAMSAASSAADYRAICAGRRDGDPDDAGTWALPHHKRPGAPANAAGVANARARFSQTEGLSNSDAARAHLFDAHKLPSETEAAVDSDDKALDAALFALVSAGIEDEKAAEILEEMGLVKHEEPDDKKAGRALSAKNEQMVTEAITAIKAAADTLETVLAAVQTQSESDEKAKTRPDPEPEVEEPEVEEVDDSDPIAWLAKIEELDPSF